MEIKIKLLDKEARIPAKAHKNDAGYDVYANQDITVHANSRTLVRTGFAYEIPDGYYLRLVGRSSLTFKTPLIINEGILDASYRGEVHVSCMVSPTTTADGLNLRYKIKKGDKIAQMILTKVEHAPIVLTEYLSQTERGAGGFGSTGKR